jgi:hypothetical protein
VKLGPHVKLRKLIQAVSEENAEERTRAYEEGSNGRLEKITV